MTETEFEQFKHAAIHEAGHTVVAHALGCPVGETVFDRDESGEWGGYCLINTNGHDQHTRRVIALAGVAAEQVHSCLTYDGNLNSWNLGNITFRLDEMSDTDATQAAGWTHDDVNDAIALVHQNWAAIETEAAYWSRIYLGKQPKRRAQRS